MSDYVIGDIVIAVTAIAAMAAIVLVNWRRR